MTYKITPWLSLCLVLTACKSREDVQPERAEQRSTPSTSSPAPSETPPDKRPEEDTLEARELLPAELAALDAKLPEPQLTRDIAGFSAEGTVVTWREGEGISRIERLAAGETYDERFVGYYRRDEPIFAQRIYRFDPAKMLSPEDEDYAEASAARERHVTVYAFQGGELATITRDGATQRFEEPILPDSETTHGDTVNELRGLWQLMHLPEPAAGQPGEYACEDDAAPVCERYVWRAEQP